MKILIPVFGFGRSGGDRVLAKLASEMINIGHDVVFVSPESSPTSYYETKANIITSKVTHKSNHHRLIRFFIKSYFLWRTCRNTACDIVIANYHLTAFIVFFLQRTKKKYYYVQANESLLCKGFLKRMVAFLTYFLPLRKIVNSDKLLPAYVNNYKAIIPAGVDLNLFYDDKSPDLSGIINIGLIGREESYKGTKESIEVLSEFISSLGLEKKIQVNIAVHLPESCKNKIKNIAFYEINNDNELASFYKKNDIFIASGLIEDGAFHYPCAEAMAAGCLVVSNYTPLLQTNSDLYISSFSKEKIIDKLQLCLNMDKHSILAEIKRNQLFVSKYSWESIGGEFNKVIKSQ